MYVYEATSRIWIPSMMLNLTSTTGLAAIMDPITNITYLPGGSIADGTTSMLSLHGAHDGADAGVRPESIAMMTGLEFATDYAIAWSAALHRMIMHGGTVNGMFSFDPISGWSTLNSTGAVPSPRTSACLVAAQGGSKMILFGGYSATTDTVLNDIYTLDMATLNWTRGPDADISDARKGAACAVSHDYFIVWGGSSFSIITNTTLLYNMKLGNWDAAYTPAKAGPTTAPLSKTTTTQPTSAPATAPTTSTLASTLASTPASIPTSTPASRPSAQHLPDSMGPSVAAPIALVTRLPGPSSAKTSSALPYIGAGLGAFVAVAAAGAFLVHLRSRSRQSEMLIDFDPSGGASSLSDSNVQDHFHFDDSAGAHGRSRGVVPLQYRLPSTNSSSATLPSMPQLSHASYDTQRGSKDPYPYCDDAVIFIQDDILQDRYQATPHYYDAPAYGEDSYEPYSLPKVQYGS
ncbi:hypothetical protein BGZ99_002040 [Dissophora globulifera]|uniref:Galactose oxidase n=1 Tax=Dissophora globulifera TaxID=979702 RepID=A0A9P6UXI4_9FUNG|nr:hypothetical protein BGZ99_002040 [Dissophora globulifera]